MTTEQYAAQGRETGLWHSVAETINWLATTEVSLLAVLALFIAYAARELLGMWFKSRGSNQ